MNVKLRTEYSLYELDRAGKRVRRLSGEAYPTSFIGEDGVWRDYEHLFGEIEVGSRPVFQGTKLFDGFRTSIIQEVIPC